jgi:ABC-type amino acid transport system permease subunit
MRRLSSWSVPMTLPLGVALGACTHPYAAFEARQAQQREAAQAQALQRREAIRQMALPSTYREQIDANFVHSLGNCIFCV